MTINFGFYADAALTTPVSSGLLFVQDVDAPSPSVKTVYFGSPLTAKVVRAASSPGMDAVLLSLVDAASGSGSPVTDVKLSLSSAGLESATSGAPLSIGVEVQSGVANAKSIYIQVLDSTHVQANNTDLSLATNLLAEFVA